uniref:Morc S5 domain-containing protein n=1 Tax=Kryptolebias marmoratus TaxID=37003 RepID=A0A3Q3B6U8_KRYMA
MIIKTGKCGPSFLNSNSTSHTWPFSAVAELIDNAADPGVSAKQIWIDVVHEADQSCLTFTDNGSGMTPSKLLHKTQTVPTSQQAIGLYGNGFKSGSMRLGRDALIFTKNGGCQTVGMLSQTYLETIKAQAVIVPIVLRVPACSDLNSASQSLVVTEDSEASLAAILQHSIINSQEQILAHFDSIPTKKGTKILIWNIRRSEKCFLPSFRWQHYPHFPLSCFQRKQKTFKNRLSSLFYKEIVLHLKLLFFSFLEKNCG